MRLIVGLGNPGPEYVYTRHNLGFMVVEELARRWGVALKSKKFPARWGQGRVGEEQVVLAQPLTYMNLSGSAVARIIAWFRLNPADMVVLHDDLDVPWGRLKLVRGGGAGGHRGVLSIQGALGSPDFFRVKLGVGRPPAWMPSENYVLGRFAADELETAAFLVERAALAVEVLLAQGLAAAQNRFHRLDDNGPGAPSPPDSETR
ncbi:MAG: aminoacyl-tRNA hydrolase [Deltaproteobacteria bacterium]|nr:aminoacyl-tRNA hydrolase [Deltaproteobacteria bacterium]